MSILGKLGSLLTGGDVFNGVKGIIGSLKLDPTVKAQLEAEIEGRKHEFAKLELEHDMRVIESVNATMREEAKSEHFMQWSWRPFVGFTFSAMLINNYILLPYFKNRGLLPIELPETIFLAMLAILGISAGTRGWEKVIKAKNGHGD